MNILAEGGVEMPLMICGGQNDPVISSSALYGWTNYFKSSDRIWQTAEGGHFFHHFYSELASYQIQHFWQQLEPKLVFSQLVCAEFN
jgi:surfactin synthase thioesterase subunit